MCILASKLLTLVHLLIIVNDSPVKSSRGKMEINKHVKFVSPFSLSPTPSHVCHIHPWPVCVNKQSRQHLVFWGPNNWCHKHATQSIYVERSFGVNRGLSRFPSFTHLAFVSQSIFMINFFHSKLCVFEFLFRLRQSHMFLIFVCSRRGDRNWEAESRVKSFFCGTFERSRVSNPSHESPPAIAWLNWIENISR